MIDRLDFYGDFFNSDDDLEDVLEIPKLLISTLIFLATSLSKMMTSKMSLRFQLLDLHTDFCSDFFIDDDELENVLEISEPLDLQT